MIDERLAIIDRDRLNLTNIDRMVAAVKGISQAALDAREGLFQNRDAIDTGAKINVLKLIDRRCGKLFGQMLLRFAEHVDDKNF